MESVVTALKATPIPTILVIGGLLFLLLAMAGQLIGRITVPPERQQWAGVTGVVLLMAGIALHVVPQVWPGASGTRNAPTSRSSTPSAEERPTRAPPAVSPTQPPSSRPTSEAVIITERGTVETRAKDIGSSSVPTTARGVVASITRFQKSGALVTMEMSLRNTSTQDVTACIHPSYTELIDQATGESWRAALHAGRECTALDAQKTGRVWMRFEVREPDGRSFALSSPFLMETVENLVLREPS
jgi:hypothetical protein